MKRRVPRLTTDEEAEAFLDSDLSDLDFSQFKSGRLRIDERPGSDRKMRITSSKPSSRLEPLPSEGHAARTEPRVPSETYRLFEQAIIERKQIFCEYDGYARELCPIILGHSEGKEKALTYQFGGKSTRTLLREGAWRCLFLHKVSNVQLREGPWYSGDSHSLPSSCVEIVDLDVNPDSPYNPKRRFPSAPLAKPAGPGRKRTPARRTGKS
jgi:hypothetical protein